MLTHASVALWLDHYVQAWKSYDAQAIGNLFSADALYYYGPYAQPVRGREAIIASWLENRDVANTYDASYRPIAVESDLAVINGRSRYFEADGKTLKREFDNIFILRFDAENLCTEFREWFMEQPKTHS